MKIEIIKSGKTAKAIWALCKNEKGDYAVLQTSEIKNPGDTQDLPYVLHNSLFWLPFQSTEKVDLTPSSYTKGYNRNSKLNFGIYKNYEVGVIYSFDAHYLEWCIHNIPEFYIEDLDILEKFGIIRYNQGYQEFRDYGVAEANSLAYAFSSIQDITRNIGMACTMYHLPDYTKQENNRKIINHR